MEVVNQNAEVHDKLHPPAPYQCITDNPGFQAVKSLGFASCMLSVQTTVWNRCC